MRSSLLLFILCATLVPGADKKKLVTNEAGNENIDIVAKAIIDPAEVDAAIGGEMPKGVIAVQLKVVPKADYKLSLNRDDFILLSHKDGQRSGPYAPSQIAGSAVMVIKSRTGPGEGGGLARQRTGPGWGGIPGTGGRPRQMDDPSNGGTGIGNVNTTETKTTAEVKDNEGAPPNPLLKLLEAKMMPDKETNDPVTGLLYFPLDGKVKVKDLELIYQGPAGRLYVDFR